MKLQTCIARDDCLRACIASILGDAIAEVPHFTREAGSEGDPDQLMKDWLAPRGLTVFTRWCEGEHWTLDQILYWYSAVNPGVPMVLSGRCRVVPDDHHAVVMLDGAIVHDPSNAGISGPCVDAGDGVARWFIQVISVAVNWTERLAA